MLLGWIPLDWAGWYRVVEDSSSMHPHVDLWCLGLYSHWEYLKHYTPGSLSATSTLTLSSGRNIVFCFLFINFLLFKLLLYITQSILCVLACKTCTSVKHKRLLATEIFCLYGLTLMMLLCTWIIPLLAYGLLVAKT